jgi:hypothetical protein
VLRHTCTLAIVTLIGLQDLAIRHQGRIALQFDELGSCVCGLILKLLYLTGCQVVFRLQVPQLGRIVGQFGKLRQHLYLLALCLELLSSRNSGALIHECGVALELSKLNCRICSYVLQFLHFGGSKIVFRLVVGEFGTIVDKVGQFGEAANFDAFGLNTVIVLVARAISLRACGIGLLGSDYVGCPGCRSVAISSDNPMNVFLAACSYATIVVYRGRLCNVVLMTTLGVDGEGETKSQDNCIEAHDEIGREKYGTKNGKDRKYVKESLLGPADMEANAMKV